MCKICGLPVIARGMCNKHYIQERKSNEPDYAKKRLDQSWKATLKKHPDWVRRKK